MADFEYLVRISISTVFLEFLLTLHSAKIKENKKDCIVWHILLIWIL